MRRNFLFLPVFVLFAAGCTSTPPVKNYSATPAMFPSEGLLVQRAMFSAIGRQFPLNGYLAISATRGKRLIITESIGMTMADVLIKPDGKVYVMQSSRMFPAHYIRSLVAEDVKCVFGGTTKRDCPVTMLATNHFVIQRTGYKLDLRIVETKTGAQPDSMFDETKAKK